MSTLFSGFDKVLGRFNIGLKNKLQIFIIGTSLITVVPILIYFQIKSSASMVQMAKDQLVSLREISAKRVNIYVNNSEKFTARLSKDRLVEGMFLTFESSFYGDGFSTGEDLSIQTTAYDKLDNLYGKRLRPQIKELNLSNIILVNPDGQVLFSALKNNKHSTLGLNLISGSLREMALAKCYASAKNSSDANTVFFADYQYYPSMNTVSSYLCTKQLAEFDHSGEGISKGDTLGVVITKLNTEFIASILTDRSGMGKTGQMYMVGADNKLRSDMHINKDKFNVLNSFKNNLFIKTSSTTASLQNKKGISDIVDPNGVKVVSAYVPIKIFGKTWGIIAEKQKNEIMKPANTILRQVILNAVIVLAIVMFIAYLFGRSLVSPILRVSNTLNHSSDELSNASEELNDASSKLSASSNQQAAATQESVAAMQEMASMINQTAEFSNKSKDISDTVKDMTTEGDKIMKNMVVSMDDINKENENMRGMVDVIKDISKKTTVINDIVFKTQLLSFNASIEAARAGQHGKGFAVVAEEVGNLANMSGNASREIYTLLENSQKKVNEAVKSTEETVKRGQDVTDKAQAIFRQIADNISLINEQIQRIVEATNEQGKGVQQTESALKQLDDAAKGNSEVAVRAQNNSLKLQTAKNELNMIISNLNRIVLGSSKKNNVIAPTIETKIAVDTNYVDPSVLDGIVAQKDSLSDEDFEKMG